MDDNSLRLVARSPPALLDRGLRELHAPEQLQPCSPHASIHQLLREQHHECEFNDSTTQALNNENLGYLYFDVLICMSRMSVGFSLVSDRSIILIQLSSHDI